MHIMLSSTIEKLVAMLAWFREMFGWSLAAGMTSRPRKVTLR